MKYLFLVLFVSIQLFANGNADVDGEELPTSWYTLPEDSPDRSEDIEKMNYTELSPKQTRGIDRVLEANALAFDKMDERYQVERGNKWRLEACILDASLSASGVLGMLVAKGEASAAMYWKKKQALRQLPVETVAPEEADLQIESDASLDELDELIEPLVRAVMATGDVKDELALRRNLTNKIFDTHEIIQLLSSVPQARFTVSRWRIDISIDVSGKVNPVTTVGGGVKLRLEWMLKKNRRNRPIIISQRNRPLGEGLKKIAENLVQQLQQVKYDDLVVQSFSLKEVKFGLGLFAEGKFGVIKVGGSLFGYLYLVPNTNYREGSDPQWTARYDSVPVIDYSLNETWIHWADSHGVQYERFENSRGERGVVYLALADRIRKGLEKTVRVSSKIAERALSHERKWELYQLKTEFALSLSGGTALFKLGGTGALELVLARQ